MDENKVIQEHKRLEALLDKANVPQQHRAMLAVVIDNLSWMRIKLDETREQIKNTSVAIPYDNGGGQKGIRENPLFKGYYALWKSYLGGLQQLASYLPKEMQDEVQGDVMTALDQVIQMKRQKNERKSDTTNKNRAGAS